MEKAGASLPLLVLPAQQAEALLYEGGSLDDQMRGKPQPHLKVRKDSCLGSWNGPSNSSGTYFRKGQEVGVKVLVGIN